MSHWLISTLQTVREKSVDALEFVRKDLVDFTFTVKNDTGNYWKKMNSQPIGDFRISRFSRTGISKNDRDKKLMASASFDRLHNERIRLQNDESTYLIDPIPIEVYDTWRETSHFNVEELKNEIAQLLIAAPHVHSIYTRLVPACTTHAKFWSRYYFRLHQLNEEETKRINLLKRAHEICNETHEDDWEEEDPNDQLSKDINHQIPTVSERKESDGVSGDSWEHEFDENDLSKSKTNAILLDTSILVTKKSDNEFDDEWE